MRNFVKGLMAGALLGVLTGAVMKPKRKPELRGMADMFEDAELKKKTGKMLKGVVRSVDKMIKR